MLDGLKLTIGARYTYERNKSSTFSESKDYGHAASAADVCVSGRGVVPF